MMEMFHPALYHAAIRVAASGYLFGVSYRGAVGFFDAQERAVFCLSPVVRNDQIRLRIRPKTTKLTITAVSVRPVFQAMSPATSVPTK